jgi:hypothetical protein
VSFRSRSPRHFVCRIDRVNCRLGFLFAWFDDGDCGTFGHSISQRTYSPGALPHGIVVRMADSRRYQRGEQRETTSLHRKGRGTTRYQSLAGFIDSCYNESATTSRTGIDPTRRPGRTVLRHGGKHPRWRNNGSYKDSKEMESH